MKQGLSNRVISSDFHAGGPGMALILLYITLACEKPGGEGCPWIYSLHVSFMLMIVDCLTHPFQFKEIVYVTS